MQQILANPSIVAAVSFVMALALTLSVRALVADMLDTMYAGASYKTVARAVHIHPTVAELLPTVLQDLHPA